MNQPMAGRLRHLGPLERYAYGSQISRLAEGGPYPIQVVPGNTVAVYKAVFDYTGPAATLYVCWGLKAGQGNFNNGANLVGGSSWYTYMTMSVPATGINQFVTFTSPTGISARLVIPDVAPALYDTFIWLSTAPTPDESKFVQRDSGGALIDTDSGVIQLSQVARVQGRNLQVAYMKV